MADNATTIWQFFASKGLSPAQIAGIMGNLQVESSFNPGAVNPAEDAHGIAQWEGSRWPALQSFAASEGKSPGDLSAQLDFLWSELSSSGTLAQIQASNNVSDVATIFDSQFERSAGTTRDERIGDAQSILSTGGGSGLSTLSAGETPLTSPGATYKPTAADYESALGPWAQTVVSTIPELKSLLDNAISIGESKENFAQDVFKTDWYRTHNQSAREIVALQTTDPAEYHTRLQNAENQIINASNQLGAPMQWQDVANLAGQYLIEGWDQNTLQGKIGAFYNGSSQQGQAAQLYQQIQQAYSDYGVPTTDYWLKPMVRNILMGNTTVDTYKQMARNQAKSMYPSLSEQIDQGATVKDIASPYMTQMANLLEIDPNNIQVSDPLVKKALQGTTTTGPNGTTTATSTPLWQFEQTLRADPRWSKTQNARDTVSSALVNIGKDYGYAV